MIWVWMAVLALVAIAPLLFVMIRASRVRYRRDTALALHRSQIEEIDRDLADGRLNPEEYHSAKIEIERRLLVADRLTEANADRSARGMLIAAAILIPVGAVALFLPGSMPFVPSEPHAKVVREEQAQAKKDDHLIAMLRTKLAQLSPNSEHAREGYILLGQALLSRNDVSRAAAAWRHALAIDFDPGLAAATAEAESEAAGHVTSGAAELFRKALAKGPKDAKWRKLAERRLREAQAILPNQPGRATSDP